VALVRQDLVSITAVFASTLEIQADVPEGIPEKVERDVSENCNTLRFREYGFRK
jgi:hypothetical protein